MLRSVGVALIAGLTFAAPALAADAPAEIKIGTLYASSGRYASISMPVSAFVLEEARMRNAWRSAMASILTSAFVSGMGWQSGISSDVFFAAMIPARRAVPSTSPLGALPASTAL